MKYSLKLGAAILGIICLGIFIFIYMFGKLGQITSKDMGKNQLCRSHIELASLELINTALSLAEKNSDAVSGIVTLNETKSIRGDNVLKCPVSGTEYRVSMQFLAMIGASDEATKDSSKANMDLDEVALYCPVSHTKIDSDAVYNGITFRGGLIYLKMNDITKLSKNGGGSIF